MVLLYSVGSYCNNLLVCIYVFYLKHLSINSTFQLTEVENAALENSSLSVAVRLCTRSVLRLHAGAHCCKWTLTCEPARTVPEALLRCLDYSASLLTVLPCAKKEAQPWRKPAHGPGT